MCYPKGRTFNQNKTTMNNDQWFEPGEKVVRVCELRNVLPGIPSNKLPIHPDTDFGKILCVHSCEYNIVANLVHFVGVQPRDNTEMFGWVAACFRRISEVQLCVKAAQHFKKPVEEEVGA